ncbi:MULTISPECIES: tail fiber protein [Paenibacillus]|uniref:Tail fiber-like repeat protein n=1 Tax=Paenibacillus pabuli TaxID=1472 RepID=A0A855YHE5_9BACL|nr:MULTISPECIES: tail fiber protein [Paenibacillus]PWW45190.1 tail fiber-like repeat protein [Paenibacillus pabuli]PXW11527.1 tail fiber-like repeat protein [Paenibacillus taichungensis]
MPKETDRLKLPLPLGNENVTRESINGIFEKIDAGVATRESILIPAESDLNSYITEGEYYCPTNATVGTLANSPIGVAFHLTVEKHAGVVQTLTTFEPSNLQVFQRNYYVGWGPWKKVPTRDDIEEVKVYTDQKIGEIVINDASLTDKGIVQLSNAVDGTREDLAATEKAVRDARVAASVQATLNAKTYTDTQINQVSKSLNLFSAAVRSSNNIFVCNFNVAPTVSNGFSFKVQFNTTNSVVNSPTYLQINGDNYHLRAEQFKTYILPNNYIDVGVVYEVVFINAINTFILKELSKDADLRGGEVVVRVGKGTATSQFSTIQAAVDFLKKFNAGVRTIRVENSSTSNSETFTEKITVKEFHGAPLYFVFDPRIRLEGYFSIDDCSAEILINGNYEVPLEIVNTNLYGIYAQNCSKLRFFYVNKTTAGFGILWAVRIQGLYASSCKISNQSMCFDLSDGCVAVFDNITGANNTYGGRISSSILMLNNYSVGGGSITKSGGAQLFQ